MLVRKFLPGIFNLQALLGYPVEYLDAKCENTIMVEIKDESKNTSNDVENLPTEQGDHNNTTTYVFEFYEEVQPETKATTAIIEEVEDDNSHKDYGWSYRRLQETPRSEKYHNYDDFKSSIHFQKELVDLHRGVLKCDKNVMTVERSVNQLTATINILEDTQNQEIKPIVMNVKRANDKMRTQIESLQFENEDLKKTIKYLKKKTIDYDKLIYFIKQSSHSKIQELENKLNTITLAQVKSIEMQNMVNKNIFKITNDIKRSHSELDSKHCCNSIKSPKNSNLTLT